MPSVADRAATWLVLHRAILAALGAILAIVSVERSRHLEFVRSIDTMFDRADPALGPYRRLAREIGRAHV